jgi:hypothetical protein
MELDLTTHNDVSHWRKMAIDSESYIISLSERWHSGLIQSGDYYCDKYHSAMERYRYIQTRIKILEKYTAPHVVGNYSEKV